MPRLPVLIRQNQVFEYVVAGRSYAEICELLQVSEDTVARDMVAIGEQVRELAKERAGEVLAIALAHFQWVIERARAEYEADLAREAAWYQGQLDFPRSRITVATKTLAAQGSSESGEGTDSDDEGTAFHSESAPLEVKRTTVIQKVRPALRGEGRSKWLQLIADTTRDITELLGIKTLVVKHEGDGKPVPHVHYTLEQWKAEAAQRLAAAEQTYMLLGDDAESDDA